jgi:hypothetical protein
MGIISFFPGIEIGFSPGLAVEVVVGAPVDPIDEPVEGVRTWLRSGWREYPAARSVLILRFGLRLIGLPTGSVLDKRGDEVDDGSEAVNKEVSNPGKPPWLFRSLLRCSGDNRLEYGFVGSRA